MVETYRFFAHLGVAAIINNHTHCPSGYEIYKGIPIFYSLGNFIFDWENVKSKNWFEDYFINLRITNNSVNKIELFPYFQCKNKPGIQLMKGKEKDAFLIKVNKYSRIIKDSELLETKLAKTIIPIIEKEMRIKCFPDMNTC
jgi:poly-gamma-glutamate synthesis protein (capsule biosynthesis protein)